MLLIHLQPPALVTEVSYQIHDLGKKISTFFFFNEIQQVKAQCIGQLLEAKHTGD